MEEGEGEDGAGAGLDGGSEDGANRADSAAAAASFWDGLLRKHWQRLQAEEEAALATNLAATQRDGVLGGAPAAGGTICGEIQLCRALHGKNGATRWHAVSRP